MEDELPGFVRSACERHRPLLSRTDLVNRAALGCACVGYSLSDNRPAGRGLQGHAHSHRGLRQGVDGREGYPNLIAYGYFRSLPLNIHARLPRRAVDDWGRRGRACRRHGRTSRRNCRRRDGRRRIRRHRRGCRRLRRVRGRGRLRWGGSPSGFRIANVIIGKAHNVGAVRVHRVYLKVFPVSVGYERDAMSVRRPRIHPISKVIVGKAHDVGAVRVHRVDIHVSIHRGMERDTLSVWRPRRTPGKYIVFCKLCDARAIHVHRVYFKVRCERDALSVRGPRRTPAVVVGKAHYVGAVRIHRVYLSVPVPLGCERDALSIWRPRIHKIATVIIGKTRDAGAVCVHCIYLPISVPVGLERDAPSIRRPRRRLIRTVIVGKTRDAGAVRVHRVYLPISVPVGYERDAPAGGLREGDARFGGGYDDAERRERNGGDHRRQRQYADFGGFGSAQFGVGLLWEGGKVGGAAKWSPRRRFWFLADC